MCEAYLELLSYNVPGLPTCRERLVRGAAHASEASQPRHEQKERRHVERITLLSYSYVEIPRLAREARVHGKPLLAAVLVFRFAGCLIVARNVG